MNSAQTIDRVAGAVDRVLMAIAALALALMMVHISADVAAGLLFTAPIPLTSAIVTEYYMIAVAFLPLVSGEYRNAHTSVDLFVNRLPAIQRGWLDLLVLALCVVVYGVLAGQAWQQAMEKLGSDAYVIEQTTRITVWPAYFIVAISFGLITALIATKVVCRLLGMAEPAAATTTEEQRLEHPGDD